MERGDKAELAPASHGVYPRGTIVNIMVFSRERCSATGINPVARHEGGTTFAPQDIDGMIPPARHSNKKNRRSLGVSRFSDEPAG